MALRFVLDVGMGDVISFVWGKSAFLVGKAWRVRKGRAWESVPEPPPRKRSLKRQTLVFVVTTSLTFFFSDI